MQLLVERVDVQQNGVEVRIRAEGLASLDSGDIIGRDEAERAVVPTSCRRLAARANAHLQ